LAALEYLDAEVDINSAWKIIRENIKISGKDRRLVIMNSKEA
jgi:hypothetical protein